MGYWERGRAVSINFFCLSGKGVTKLETFQWCFVTKYNTSKQSAYSGKLKVFFIFVYNSALSSVFLDKYGIMVKY
jgi:hypothetical protein